MWVYEKRLQMPVDVKKRDLRMAKNIYAALGGADGELSASMEYLQQRSLFLDVKIVLTTIVFILKGKKF